MLENSLKRQKRELLSRVASERVQTLESAGGMCRDAEAGIRTLQGSGRVLRCIGWAATGLAAAGVCTVAARSMIKRPRRVAQPVAGGGFLRALLLQGATVVLFPYVRDLLMRQRRAGEQTGSPANRPLIDLPTQLFFRWLGLEK